MTTRIPASQENSRNLKHLLTHILVNMGFLVFSNVGAKDAIDLVIGMHKSGELRIAGIRIKTSSYSKKRKSWSFSETEVKYFIKKPHFFYIFCLKKDDDSERMFTEPIFVVISSTDLKKMSSTVRNGNYRIEIYKNQIEKKSKWTNYLGRSAFEQIRRELEG